MSVCLSECLAATETYSNVQSVIKCDRWVSSQVRRVIRAAQAA